MDDASLVAAFQLADSFFPSGMVTFSHGLETFYSMNSVLDVDIALLLTDYLQGKIATCDLIAYAHAHRAAAANDLPLLHEIDNFLTATILPQELRQASARSTHQTDSLRPSTALPLRRRFPRGIPAGS